MSDVQHKCNSVLVQCMDFRIQDTLTQLLDQNSCGTTDKVSLPGGAGKNPDLVDQWVDLSIQLHDPDLIVLTVHEDCGAGATREDLVNAHSRLKEKLSNKKIQSFFVNLDGTWSEIE